MTVAEMDLRSAIDTLWRQKLIIASSLLLSLLIALLYLGFATYRYTVTLVVTPVQSSSSSLSGNLAGLADIAGVALPGDASENSFKLYLEAFKSRPVADVLAKDQKLMAEFFPDDWSESEQRWREPRSIRKTVTTAVRRMLGLPVYPWKRPDGSRLQEVLARDIDIVETRDQPAVQVVLATTSPSFGIHVVNRLHNAVDELIKQRVLARAGHSIVYLQNRLKQESIADYRLALIGMTAKQEQLRMLASSGASYAADPFGPPSASRFPVTPRPLIVLVIALLLGLVIGISSALAIGRLSPRR